MNKIRHVFEYINDKKYKALATMTVIVLSTPLSAYADVKMNIGPQTNVSTVVGRIVGVILSIFLYIGVLLLCWAIGMLVMAFRNEDADSKSRAMMLLVVSAALIGLKTFLGSGGIGIIK